MCDCVLRDCRERDLGKKHGFVQKATSGIDQATYIHDRRNAALVKAEAEIGSGNDVNEDEETSEEGGWMV